MPTHDLAKLRAIKSFTSLVKYLKDDLDWPLESDEMEPITFEYSAKELGLGQEYESVIKEIRQLRPLTGNQPWGIFFVNFEKKKLPVVVMRRLLRALVFRKRASANKADRQAWQPSDLLFISAYGEEDHREITMAHFVENEEYGNLAELRVLGWDDDDTPLKYDYIATTLHEKLGWRSEYTRDPDAWRKNWREAFVLRHREVITTSKALALAMAHLAKRIRGRVRSVLRFEDGFGEVQKLKRAFRAALIHDLSDDDFADMWAQTITYGLFSAAVSRPAGIHSGNLVDMVPVTNPFLRDMLATFLNISGRKGKIDFDELGIQEVVDLLNSDDTHLDAVLRDFGNRTRQEDPVIHFYELFLTEYDKQRKIQRGVFYTPQPVVSYIVRSVHQLLQTEFGLADGLASSVTWGEMLKRHPGMKLPPLTDEPGEKRTIDPNEPFVLILDIATGTATFIVEVIDVIHKTMMAKWKKEGGAGVSPAKLNDLWNDYVPKHLLPRVYGFELMMCPYAIAHMKVGLKLTETGYKFRSNERARIYLTNTLEPKVRQLPAIGFEALAHEAAAVNEVKWYKRFTVAIGNPPYSLLSANLESHHRALVEHYKFINGERIRERGALQLEKNLNDDYVKFIRITQLTIERAGVGIFGLITNHSFLDNPTMRGLRWSLLNSCTRVWLNDLHGNSTKQEQPPNGGEDVNVFQIKQGVAVSLSVRLPSASGIHEARHHERWGTRESKEAWLAANHAGSHAWQPLDPTPDLFLFVPQNSSLKSEFEAWPSLADVMPANGAGYITARDNLVIDFERDTVIDRVRAFNASRLDDNSLLEAFDVADKKGWDAQRARAELKRVDIPKRVIRTNYRPFDTRWIFFDGTLVWGRSWPTMQHVVGHPRNLTMLATRMTKDQWDVWVARTVSSHKAMSAYDTNSVFPLYLTEDSESSQRSIKSEHRINFTASFLKMLARVLNVSQKGEHGLPDGLTPEDIFHYAYAVFHSPGYRTRYAEFLKIDFPRLPLTARLDLFRALAALGGDLVALHLLESPQLDHPLTKFIGDPKQEIEKVTYADKTVWIDKAQTTGFKGVPDNVWNFHIGGYQVCEKWLKDRGPKQGNPGRVLSKDDIAHYQKVVVALNETIGLMSEIDKVIEKHGGWPIK